MLKKIFSWLLTFIMVFSLSATIPQKVSAGIPMGAVFTDVDLDHVYFKGDSLSFNLSGLPVGAIPSGTSLRVSLGIVDASSNFSDFTLFNTLSNGMGDGTGFYAERVLQADGTLASDISGTIVSTPTPTLGIIAVKLYMEVSPNTWQNVMQAQTPDYIPLIDGSNPATVGLDGILELPDGVTSNPILGAGEQNVEDLRNLNISFSKTIAAGITGSITFADLDLFANTTDLADLEDGLIMSEVAIPELGTLAQYTIGLDEANLNYLASLGAIVSVSSDSFDGYDTSDFEAVAADVAGGLVSKLSYDDDSNTVSFEVDHFSSYTLSVMDIPYVCKIGETEYVELSDALDEVTSGQTIKLLTDVTYSDRIWVGSSYCPSLTLDLNGYKLEISNVEVPIAAIDGYSINITDDSVSGGGILDLNTTSEDSAPTGVTAVGTGSIVSVGSEVEAIIRSTADNGKGVSAYYGGSVEIGNASITVPISGSSTGVYADGVGNSISVTGDVNGGWIGAYTAGGTVSIVGDVSTGYEGSGSGVRAYGGTISVTGNVSSTGGGNYGAYADNEGIINVTGNVTSGSVGVAAYNASEITIDGVISYSVAYIEIGSYANYLNEGNYEVPTTKEGYLTYTDDATPANTVWVKAAEVTFWTDGITSTDQYPFGGGNGSSEALAYEISTANQLAQLAYNVNNGNDYTGKYFKLMNDLDLAGKEWTPIGHRFYPGYENGFNGNFDGNNKSITNIAIGSSSEPKTGGDQTQAGLFGAAKYVANINDLHVQGSLYVHNVSGVGMLLGYSESDGSISGCTAEGTIVSTGSGDIRIGGLIGDSSGTSVIGCSSDVDINASNGSKAVGGLIGYHGAFSYDRIRPLDSCIYTGTLTSGNITGDGGVGGIAGKSYGYTIIYNSINKGTVTGSEGNIGGIVGIQHNEGIINCYSSGAVAGNGNNPTAVGGITGYIDWGKVYNCYDSGRVSSTGTALVGALVGNAPSTATIVSNGYFDGTINDDIAHVRSTSGNKYYLHEFTTEVMKGADPGSDIEYADGVYANGENAIIEALNGWINLTQSTYQDTVFKEWNIISTFNNGYPYLTDAEDPGPEHDATLSALTASGVTLSPAFSPSVTSYSANVNNSKTSVSIATTSSNSNAIVNINGENTLTKDVNLVVGSNTITILVTAEDTITTENYTITLNRAAASSGGGQNIGASSEQKVTITTPEGDNGVAGTLTISEDLEQITIGGTQFGQLAKTNRGVLIPAPAATVIFDGKAVDTINRASSTGDVVLAVEKIDPSDLTPEQQNRVLDRPVFDFTITKGGKQVSSFGGGHATISIPYTLRSGEHPQAIVIYYLADDGSLKTIRGYYDAKTKTVVFRTTHFSQFVIGHNPVTFSDVASIAWYREAVEFIAARGITIGTGVDTFGPNDMLTRGQFLVLLMKAYEITPDAAPIGIVNFADAGDSYYADYLLAAKRLGIVEGIGDNLFGPNQAITRQELFVMLFNALKTIDEVPTAVSSKQLSDFSDAIQLASWAEEAVNKLIGGGIVSGIDDKLAPVAYATRAQIAQILFILLSK